MSLKKILILLTVFLLITPAAASSYPPKVPRFESTPCVFRLSSELSKLKKRCGFVVVLEQHGVARGRAIRLAVTVLQHDIKQKSKNALIYLGGGPGGSSALLGTYLTGDLARAFTGLEDLILFDQRGVGFSQPALNCGAQVVFCRELYAKAGTEISAFNSIENALDISDIRAQLGYEKLDVYGISYGTLLAQHVMRLDSDIIRSVTLDAVLPVGINAILDNIQTRDRALRRVFEACNNDIRCSQAFPDLYYQLEQAFDNVRDRPIPVDFQAGTLYGSDIRLDEQILFGFLIGFLYDTDANFRIPQFIRALATRDSRTLGDILSPYFSASSENVQIDTFARGMFLTIVCREMMSYDTDDWMTRLGFDILPIYRKLSFEQTDNVFDDCKNWHSGAANKLDLEPVTSSIPTFILTGRFDPVTPSEYAKGVARYFDHSQLVEFMGGHGALTHNANLSCASKLFQDFLLSLNTKLDASCANRPVYWAGVPDDQPPTSRPNVR